MPRLPESAPLPTLKDHNPIPRMARNTGKTECVLPKAAFERSNSGPFQFVHTFIKDSPGHIKDHYMVTELLGTGAYGSASRAICRSTGIERAVKCIPLKRVKDPARFDTEINIAKQLDHPNVVRLFETFRDDDNAYLVMELCTGGELFERIMEAPEGFDEARASVCVRQILAALSYLHAHDFAHRDVKPENFLFQSRGEDADLKLIDFGLACQFKRGCPMATKVGTPYYVAPEVLQGCYDAKCDVWSAGVLAYILLCGYPPFHGEADKDVLRRVRRGIFSFPSPDWDHISQNAKRFIEECLSLEPSLRPSAAAALRSSWVQDTLQTDTAPATTSAGIDFVEKLQEFQAQTRMKRVALTAVAQQLHDDDIKALQRAFRALDQDGDGMLSYTELKEGLAQSGVPVPPQAVLDELLSSIDTTGSGSLDYTEFLAATVDEQLYGRLDVCWAAFRTFDLDGDGKISQAELEHVLGGGDADKSPSKSRIQRMVSEVDTSGDGCIDFEEFYTMMKTVSPTKPKAGSSLAASGMEEKHVQEPAPAWDEGYLDHLEVRSALFVER